MGNSFDCWEMVGIGFVILFGTLLHFVYKCTNQNKIVGLFSPVNESVWEHLKMLFVPMLLYSAVEYFAVGNQFPNFIAGKVIGAVYGMITILIIFYTYTGITGRHFLWADILAYFFGVWAAFAYCWQIISQSDAGSATQCVALIVAMVLIVSFAVFTYYPPHIPLFLDPIHKVYGVPQKTSARPKS
jgi:uncharacterized MnhB-related membrane protein